jgi:hypothetical protein
MASMDKDKKIQEWAQVKTSRTMSIVVNQEEETGHRTAMGPIVSTMRSAVGTFKRCEVRGADSIVFFDRWAVRMCNRAMELEGA